MLINEEFCFHERVFYFDPLKLNHLVVCAIFILGFLGNQPSLLLQIFKLLLNDANMASDAPPNFLIDSNASLK
jgi:hypothetical protein